MGKYFVMHLSERDYKPTPEVKYEIQLLDSRGRAKDSIYFSSEEDFAKHKDKNVPFEVFQAAMRQDFGQGDYVDNQGNSVAPF